MFCAKCGSQITEGEQFCSECGTPVGNDVRQTMQTIEQPPEKAPKKTKKGRMPFFVSLAALLILIVAGLAVGGYDLIKTKEFREIIASFEKLPDEFAGLGKYQKEYDDILDDAQSASSRFQFWKYNDLADRMDDLANEIQQMNDAVAQYRETYEKLVRQMEVDGHFLLGDYEEEYLSIKSDLESALSDFDERESKKKSGDFEDICDDIIEANEEMASEYSSEAQFIRDSFDASNAHSFELYMIGDFVNKIEADNTEQDYTQLYDDYLQLSSWVDKFYAANQAWEQIGDFVQADVSGSDEVKLYLSSHDYDQYNFLLEDFIVYEQNGGIWNECDAVGISQIKGTLTMDLVVDVSDSMYNDFYTMQCAVEGFVNSTETDTAIGLSTIGSIYERLEEFTYDKNRIINSVWGLECYGLTSLYQSLYSSVVYTASSEGARCVVAFTDGLNVPYGSGYDYDAQDVIDVSLYYQVPVYIIGLGSHLNSDELRNIAEATGGAYYDRVSVYDLQNIYAGIYEAQGKLYELSYKTAVPNNVNRNIYVLYADDTTNLSIRFESELNAEALREAYATSNFSAGDLSSFYTDSKYLSSDDLSKLGDDLEAVQTVINIYYAMNGYQFGDSENGQKQLAKMISLGVVSENGTLGGDEVTAILRANPVLYQNFSALYNYRYELIYTVAYNIYWNNPRISYEELRSEVHRHYGETNETRFDSVTRAAWKALQGS